MEEINELQKHIWVLQDDLQHFGGEDEDYELLERLVEQLNTLKANRRRQMTEEDRKEQREAAMEAGMLHGVNAYNEAMGY